MTVQLKREKEKNEEMEIYRRLEPQFILLSKLERLKPDEEGKEIIQHYQYAKWSLYDLINPSELHKYLPLKRLLLNKKGVINNQHKKLFLDKINFLPPRIKLNPEQQEFLKRVQQNRENKLIYLSGFPGSGKTEVAMELARRSAKSNNKILVVAEKHATVNELLERFCRYLREDEIQNLGIIRYHTPETKGRAKEKVKNTAILSHFTENIVRTYYDKIINGIKLKHSNTKIQEILQDWIRYLKNKEYPIPEGKSAITDLIMLETNVVFSTTTALGRKESIISTWLEEGVNLMILDEGKATKIVNFLIGAKYAKSWVVIGDISNKPQPPSVELIKSICLSRWENIKNKLSKFLACRKEELSEKIAKKTQKGELNTISNKWEKEALKYVKKDILAETMNVHSFFSTSVYSDVFEELELNYNYRMEEGYLKLLLSETRNKDLVLQKPLGEYFIHGKKKIFNTRIVYFDISNLDGWREKEKDSSYINLAECWAIQKFLESFSISNQHENSQLPFRILILSAYQEQVKLLMKIKSQINIEGVQIDVETIDSSDTLEADLVIWSLTRSKVDIESKSGIVDDISRIYKVITRPKKAILIVGTRKMLEFIIKKVTRKSKSKHRKTDKQYNAVTNFFEVLSDNLSKVTIK